MPSMAHEILADLIKKRPMLAAWCAKPSEAGAPGFVPSPYVLDPADVPFVTDPGEAARWPELAVLSVLAHGEGEQGAAIAAAVLPAIQKLDDDRARFYYDLVYISLSAASRQALEEMKGYEHQTDFAKKYVAQGLTQGRTEEAARNLLTVLRVRGFAVPDHIRERILAETDPERLERWLEKAVVAPSLAALIDEPN